MTTKDGQQLHDLVAAVVEERRAAPRQNPAKIAEEVMARIDPKGIAPPLVSLGCNLEVRQMARGLLAKHFDPLHPAAANDDPDQLDLLEVLQWRYPEAPKAGEARPDGPSYVLRDLMTNEDVEWNVRRLRAESRAKLAHADALEAWNADRSRPVA